jgi:hypothetical protein
MNLRSLGAAKVLGAASLVLVSGVGWNFVLGPVTSSLAGVHDETRSALAQNDLLELQLLELKDQSGHIDVTRRTAGALAAKFPPTADQPGLFGQVTAAAAAAGIRPQDVTAVTPTPPTFGTDPAGSVTTPPAGERFLARQTVTISVEGSYLATRRLLSNLEEIPRAFAVSGLTVGAGATPSAYTATITGNMFVMPPAVDPEPAAQAR